MDQTYPKQTMEATTNNESTIIEPPLRTDSNRSQKRGLNALYWRLDSAVVKTQRNIKPLFRMWSFPYQTI